LKNYENAVVTASTLIIGAKRASIEEKHQRGCKVEEKRIQGGF
jgi:hypothetical protein